MIDDGATMTWQRADERCRAYGGQWRLPALEELERLFTAGMMSGYSGKLGELVNGGWAWSSRTDSYGPWYYAFGHGERMCSWSESACVARAICVQFWEGET